LNPKGITWFSFAQIFSICSIQNGTFVQITVFNIKAIILGIYNV